MSSEPNNKSGSELARAEFGPSSSPKRLIGRDKPYGSDQTKTTTASKFIKQPINAVETKISTLKIRKRSKSPNSISHHKERTTTTIQNPKYKQHNSDDNVNNYDNNDNSSPTSSKTNLKDNDHLQNEVLASVEAELRYKDYYIRKLEEQTTSLLAYNNFFTSSKDSCNNKDLFPNLEIDAIDMITAIKSAAQSYFHSKNIYKSQAHTNDDLLETLLSQKFNSHLQRKKNNDDSNNQGLLSPLEKQFYAVEAELEQSKKLCESYKNRLEEATFKNNQLAMVCKLAMDDLKVARDGIKLLNNSNQELANSNDMLKRENISLNQMLQIHVNQVSLYNSNNNNNATIKNINQSNFNAAAAAVKNRIATKNQIYHRSSIPISNPNHNSLKPNKSRDDVSLKSNEYPIVHNRTSQELRFPASSQLAEKSTTNISNNPSNSSISNLNNNKGHIINTVTNNNNSSNIRLNQDINLRKLIQVNNNNYSDSSSTNNSPINIPKDNKSVAHITSLKDLENMVEKTVNPSLNHSFDGPEVDNISHIAVNFEEFPGPLISDTALSNSEVHGTGAFKPSEPRVNLISQSASINGQDLVMGSDSSSEKSTESIESVEHGTTKKRPDSTGSDFSNDSISFDYRRNNNKDSPDDDSTVANQEIRNIFEKNSETFKNSVKESLSRNFGDNSCPSPLITAAGDVEPIVSAKFGTIKRNGKKRQAVRLGGSSKKTTFFSAQQLTFSSERSDLSQIYRKTSMRSKRHSSDEVSKFQRPIPTRIRINNQKSDPKNINHSLLTSSISSNNSSVTSVLDIYDKNTDSQPILPSNNNNNSNNQNLQQNKSTKTGKGYRNKTQRITKTVGKLFGRTKSENERNPSSGSNLQKENNSNSNNTTNNYSNYSIDPIETEVNIDDLVDSTYHSLTIGHEYRKKNHSDRGPRHFSSDIFGDAADNTNYKDHHYSSKTLPKNSTFSSTSSTTKKNLAIKLSPVSKQGNGSGQLFSRDRSISRNRKNEQNTIHFENGKLMYVPSDNNNTNNTSKSQSNRFYSGHGYPQKINSTDNDQKNSATNSRTVRPSTILRDRRYSVQNQLIKESNTKISNKDTNKVQSNGRTRSPPPLPMKKTISADSYDQNNNNISSIEHQIHSSRIGGSQQVIESLGKMEIQLKNDKDRRVN